MPSRGRKYSFPKIVRKLAKSVMDNRPSVAKVVSIDEDKISIQIDNSPVFIRNVDVDGTTEFMTVGQEVSIVWDDTGRPVAVVSDIGNLLDVVDSLQAQIDELRDRPIEFDDVIPLITGIFVYSAFGTLVDRFQADADGMQSAIDSSTSGGTIWIPACTISGSFTIPSEVKVVGLSRYATRIFGAITMSAGASIENLSVKNTVSDAGNVFGVKAGTSGIGYLNGCNVECRNSGGGHGYGIYVNDVGSLQAWQCEIFGIAIGSLGYGGFHEGDSVGSIQVYGGRVVGSTNPFNK